MTILNDSMTILNNTMTEEERILRRIPFEILILALITALASLFFFNPLTAVFIFAGGVLATLSFMWLKQALTKFLLSGKKKAIRHALLLYGIRLVLIIAIFFIIIFFFSRNIIAFVAGFSAIVPVFLAEAVAALTRMKKWKV
jgi:hypothetical protein